MQPSFLIRNTPPQGKDSQWLMFLVARILSPVKSEASGPCVGPTLIFFSWVSSMTRDLMICGLRSLPVFLLRKESPLLGHHRYTLLKHKGTKNTLQRSSLMLRPCCFFSFWASLQDVHANGKRMSIVLILHQVWSHIGEKDWTAEENWGISEH